MASATAMQGKSLTGEVTVSRNALHLNMGIVERDGLLHQKDDPPEPACAYIPPGDKFKESYRLSTFRKFPENVPVRTTELASSGFYYTGYKDRVKCCSCCMSVENWIEGDNACDSKWHKPDCSLMSGCELQNSPLLHKFGITMRKTLYHYPTTQETSLLDDNQNPRVVDEAHADQLRKLDLKKEEDRRKTFEKWPSYPVPDLPKYLAENGFFYLGNLDRVQCFSCSGVLRNWDPNDVVREEHLKFFPQCRLVTGKDTQNIPASQRVMLENAVQQTRSVENQDPSEDEQRHLLMYLPCKNPANPDMTSLLQRIETFSRWSANHTSATIEQIATAGFYCLDGSDETKCFYCNGGLKNWEFEDDPWEEHAKWFPGCEYVVRNKGVKFVRTYVDAHPNLDRPEIRNRIDFRAIPPYEESASNEDNQQIGNLLLGSRKKSRSVEAVQHRPGGPDSGMRSDNCFYVPPGDERIEMYRLATLGKYFKTHLKDAIRKAKGGYFYTGYKDRLKCSCCGAYLNRWTATENAVVNHFPNCHVDFANENVPMEHFVLEEYQYRGEEQNRSSIINDDKLVHADKPRRKRALSWTADD